MDKLHLCIAITPLAIYLLWLARVNLRRRPTVISGFRDAFYLALAVSGFATAGPLELFLPETAAFRFGVWVWLLLIVLYCLVASLAILSLRPRIVAYNLSSDELRPALASAVQKLDPQARWVGDTVDMPGVEIHLHHERSPAMRNIQLVSSGAHQNFAAWTDLEKELKRELAESNSSPSGIGLSFLMVAALFLAVVAAAIVGDRESMAQMLQEMLRM